MAESVWDYPRPPRLESSTRRIQVELGGKLIADSGRCFRVLETSHPPTWYIPREAVLAGVLERSGRNSFCEWKGQATYWNLQVGNRRVADAAWSYEHPLPPFSALVGHLAFYPSKVDACYVDGERVQAQPGDFYGGWITSDVQGPFKGGAGTSHW